MSELNSFEFKAMNALLDGSDPILDKLRKQFSNSAVLKREFSGVGFFTHFSVVSTFDPVTPPNFVISDVSLVVQGLQYGASAMLFVRDGKIDFLEVVANTGDWPKEAILVSIGYFKKKVWTKNLQELEHSDTRDLEVTRMAWEKK